MPSLNFNQITKAYRGTQLLDKIYHGNKQVFPIFLPDPFVNNTVLHLKGENLLDSSPTPKTVTASGGIATSTLRSKYGGSSILFDGTNDVLSIPRAEINLSTIGNCTIEAWINVGNVSNATKRQLIVCTYNNPGGFQVNTFYLAVYGNKIEISDGVTTAFGATVLLPNTWYHVCAVGSSGISKNWKVYLNGVLEHNVTRSVTQSASNLFIGGSPGDNNLGSAWFGGDIDSLRISNVNRYTANFNPETETYLAY